MNLLKKKIMESGCVTGIWISSTSPTNAEIASEIGFDFIILDMEHGPGNEADALDVLRAIKGNNTECILRAPENNLTIIKKYLDIGVRNIMIPQVSSRDEALMAVSATKYPPLGKRGFAADALRCSMYGLNGDYLENANNEVFTIVQVEDRLGVDNVNTIASVDGIDMLFIGPADLSGSYGGIGNFDDPDFQAAVGRVESVCKNMEKMLGIVPYASRQTRELIQSGYSLIAEGSDIIMLREAMKDAFKLMNS